MKNSEITKNEKGLIDRMLEGEKFDHLTVLEGTDINYKKYNLVCGTKKSYKYVRKAVLDFLNNCYIDSSIKITELFNNKFGQTIYEWEVVYKYNI